MHVTSLTGRHIINIAMVGAGLAVFALTAHDVVSRILGEDENRALELEAEARPESRELSYDIRDITESHLFGVVVPDQASEIANAPETKLKLSLKGLISSDDARIARALIGVNSSPVNGYRIGEQITGTDAQLYAVEERRVLLDRDGAVESLVMPRSDVLSGTAGNN